MNQPNDISDWGNESTSGEISVEESVTLEENSISSDITDEDINAAQKEKSEEDNEKIAELTDTINSLKEKIAELEAASESQKRLLNELGEFNTLFPDVSVSNLPEEVWESVKAGTALAASYALYEKRMEAESQRIAKINASNFSKSAGVAGKHTKNEYFTPEEVRNMSRAEVHINYSKIKESMKKWI